METLNVGWKSGMCGRGMGGFAEWLCRRRERERVDDKPMIYKLMYGEGPLGKDPTQQCMTQNVSTNRGCGRKG